MQTTIQVKPHGGGWKVFESVGVKPVFPEKDYARFLEIERGALCR